MNRISAAAGSLLFLLMAPGLLAGYLPWMFSRWRMQPPLLHFPLFRILGILLIAAGIFIILDCFACFALQGLGTPAPIAPPKHLVITGWYRYVRNPMYVGVSWVIFGQGFLLGDRQVLGYGLVVWLGFFVFVLGYEEPTLRRTFGDEYETFCNAVPRWIPRMTAWRGEDAACG
jgi:protein-S-isoprenylcysteine O-methyltransferase Ste14